MFGGKGDDYLLGSVVAANNDRIVALGRNLNPDFTRGSPSAAGNLDMVGGLGDDVIIGGYGDDDIYGGEGDDIIYGNYINVGKAYGTDYIEGGPGDDFIAGMDVGSGDDAVIKGGSGNDVIGAGFPETLATLAMFPDSRQFTFTYAGDGESATTQERIFLYGDDGDDNITGINAISA